MCYKNFDDMPLVLDVIDIADTLSIGRNKAYELVNSGAIESIRIGQQYRIPRDAFKAFIERTVLGSK